MASGRLALEYPHKNLLEIAEDETRFKVLCAGRRCGKTSLAKYLTAKHLLKGAGNVAYITPTISMAEEIFYVFYSGLESIAVTKSVQQQSIRLQNGAFFKIFSADKSGDKLRGTSNDFIVVDEAAMIHDLEDMLYFSAMPTLADRQGSFLIISTPKGRNAFYNLWMNGQYGLQGHPNFANWKSWKRVTADNPYIPPGEIEIQKAGLPERTYRQEFLAEFILDGGEFFRGVRDASTIKKDDDFGVNPYRGSFAVGIDFGRKHDFTVISVIDIEKNEQVALYRFNLISWEDQRMEIKEIVDVWQPVTVFAEENSFGETNIEELEKLNIDITAFYTTAKSKKRILDALSVEIENGELKLLEDEIQMQELESFMIKPTEAGNFKFSAPKNGHDDTVMALAIANEAKNNSKGIDGFAMPKLW